MKMVQRFKKICYSQATYCIFVQSCERKGGKYSNTCFINALYHSMRPSQWRWILLDRHNCHLISPSFSYRFDSRLFISPRLLQGHLNLRGCSVLIQQGTVLLLKSNFWNKTHESCSSLQLFLSPCSCPCPLSQLCSLNCLIGQRIVSAVSITV